MLERLRSRKLWAAIIAAVVIIADRQLSLGLDDTAVQSLTALVVAYILGQAYVDRAAR